MEIHAIIIEQLEWDGQLKSFRLQAQQDLGQMWVAFPDEYQEDRIGPFHFLDSGYENLLERKISECENRKLSKEKFYEQNGKYNLSTTWNQIPTQRHQLTFYSLYFPEYAIPDEIILSDTYIPGKIFKKTVYRDDEKRRYIVYLECRSNTGVFNFKLNAQFYKSKSGFHQSQYKDTETIGFYERPLEEHWHYLLPDKEVKNVSNFFAGGLIINHKKNNPWISGSFYLFVAATVFTGLAVISKMITAILLPVIIIGGILLIGGL